MVATSFNRRTSPLGNDRITMFPNSSGFSSRPLYFIVYWCTFLEFSSNEPVATSKLCSPNKKDSNNRKIPATNKVKRCIPQNGRYWCNPKSAFSLLAARLERRNNVASHASSAINRWREAGKKNIGNNSGGSGTDDSDENNIVRQ